MKVAIIDTETEGLNNFSNKIIAIGIKTENKEEIIMENSEKDTILKFFEKIDELEIDRLVGFNLEFDKKFILLRSLKNDLIDKYIETFSKLEIIDLSKILNDFLTVNSNYKLSTWCKFFSINDEDEYKGTDIPTLFKLKELDKIVEHLKMDLRKTFQIYKRVEKFLKNKES